jgi:MSHA biogenesis protein MshQ
MNNEFKKNLSTGYMKYRVSQIILLIILMMSSILPVSAWAACSSQINLATINELNSNNRNNLQFLEVKVLDSSLISSGEYLNWSVRVCRQSGSRCTSSIPLSSASLSNNAYLVLDGSNFPNGYGDFRNGLEVSLLDGNGDIIDYLSVGNYSDLGNQGCTGFAYDTTVPTSNTLDLRRKPDGTGDWDYEPGNSGGSTEGDTNDDDSGLPTLILEDILVEPGQDAVITLNLSSTSGDAIILNYTTYDGTASAGSDYVATTGTVTIPAGDTSATFTITTLAGATVGEYFNYFISIADSSPGIATISDHVGTVTFYEPPAPIGAWYFDELAWGGSSGEVVDSTGNGLDGTALGGASTSFADPPGPALTGDPGTCRFGEFDGNNDYVQLPGSFPDLQDSFTISAWINPDRINGDQRILVDDESNTGGYAFSLGDGGDGRLRFFSRNINPVVVDTQSAVISAGQWFHVAAVHNISDKTRQIFVNGVAVRLDNNDFISTYSGTWGVDPGMASIGGETNNAGSEAVSRWRFDGYIDEVRVYDVALSGTEVQAVMNETHPCAIGPTLGWIEITAGSAASTCAPHPVTITAYDSDPAINPGAQIFTNYTGTVVLATQTGHGNWSINSANGALSPNPHTTDNGQATYTFVSADQGSAILDLSNVHADDLTISATDIVAGVTVLSPLISFRDNAFVITPVTCTDSSCPATGSTELVAGRDHVFNAALWRRDPSSGDCAIATDYDTASNAAYGDLKAWIIRDAVDPSGIAPEIGGSPLGNAVPALNNLDLNFTSGQTQFTLSTSDVGKYDVNLRDDTSGFAMDDQGNNNPADDVPRPISGSSDTLTVRPFALGYTNINKDGTPNPSGTATTGAGFVAAGDSFAATVGAYLWQSADDGDNNGLVDDPTTDDVTNNGLTPAYNFLTTLSVDNTGGFTPVAGVAGALGGTTTPNSFTGGSQTINDLTYSEVGSMRLLANTTAFLGTTGADISGQTPDTGPVGRFYPHHFDIGSVNITEACASGGFTYMDQDELQLQYTLVAQNLGNTTTSNYFTAGYTTGTVTAVAENNNDGNDLSGRLSNTGSVDWVGGQYVINVTNAQFDRAATPDGPFDNLQLGVYVTDQDNAEIQNRDMKPDDTTACTAMTCTARSLGTTMMRYGRIAMTNAYGSEILPLTLTTVLQYYDGTFFVNNDLDSCSTLAITDVDLSNNEQTNERDGTITINGTTVTASVQNSPANSGALNIDVSAPGAGNTGYVDIQPDLSTATGADMPWLLFDWDGDAGTVDEAPVGRATFGIFGGNPQQIYMQELY